MASATVNCSPKTFSPRVLIHRTDYNNLTNTCKLGKPNIVLSRKSFTTSPIHVGIDRVSITKTEPVELELRNLESNRKQLISEKIKTDRETSKIGRDFHANQNGGIDHKLTFGNSSDVWNETRIMSPLDPPLKYICGCCKCCSDNFSDACTQKPKDAHDFRTILPQIFKIKDEHFSRDPKGDSLRWTLFNSSTVNKRLINLSCNGMAPFGGPIWSNRWIYPDLETYADQFLKDEIISNSKESTKSVTSLTNNASSSISSSCLTKSLPIAIGNTCYNARDGNNVNRVFFPLLSQNSMVLPVPTCATFTVPSSNPSSPPASSSSSSSCTSASSSVASMCLFRRESFFSYDRKPLLYDMGSYSLQTKLKRDPAEDDESAVTNKRFKYSDEKKITAGQYYSNTPYVNSITAATGTKYNGANTTKTTSIYKVPKDSVNEKRQIQKTKNFHCPFCNISCSNRGQLQGHVRIHTGERPFVCQEPQCGKAFIRNEELTRHRRIHTGERPHICPVCKKAFTRKDHLSKHMKTHT